MRKALIAMAAGVAVGAAGLFAADRVLRPALPPHEIVQIERFPDVTLQTHDGRTVRFYRDLIQGKVVAINFMYVACTSF